MWCYSCISACTPYACECRRLVPLLMLNRGGVTELKGRDRIKLLPQKKEREKGTREKDEDDEIEENRESSSRFTTMYQPLNKGKRIEKENLCCPGIKRQNEKRPSICLLLLLHLLLPAFSLSFSVDWLCTKSRTDIFFVPAATSEAQTHNTMPSYSFCRAPTSGCFSLAFYSFFFSSI